LIPVIKPIKKKKVKVSDSRLLKLWGQKVKERAGNRCEYPDCNVNYSQTHPHHFFSRRHASLRYDIENGLCLCPTHHTMGYFSAHKDPCFKDRIIACGVRSAEWLERLIVKRNMVVKNNDYFKLEDLEVPSSPQMSQIKCFMPSHLCFLVSLQNQLNRFSCIRCFYSLNRQSYVFRSQL